MSERDLVFEIGTEEIPSDSVSTAIGQLQAKAAAALERERLVYQRLDVYGAPRRLALYVHGLSEVQSPVVLEVKGPAKKAAFSEQGEPTKAAEGFAKAQGVSVADLEVRAIEGGEYVFAINSEKGQPTVQILPRLLPEIMLSLSFPKAMRWGSSEIRFVRPIRWLVALFGNEPVEFSIDGIISGNLSWGQRFLASNPLTLPAADQYLKVLKTGYVMADQKERQELIRTQVEQAAAGSGGQAVIDSRTFGEVVNLVENPHAILGSFPEEFVVLPRDVLVTAMEAHQRYFPVEDEKGKLLPKFVVVQNGDPQFTDLIRRGHERVLKARLADAKFFFEEDTKQPLTDYVERLKGVVFQAKLGTLYHKTLRVQSLVEFIGQELVLLKEKLELAKRAAYQSKADLVTEMVVEFPVLQGAVGREYARVAGEAEETALGIFEHYLPRFTGDDLPATDAGKLVSVGDKLDTIVGYLAVGLIPTGSEDPYALRRQATGLISVILANGWHLSMTKLVETDLKLYQTEEIKVEEAARSLIVEFLQGRLRAYLVSAGMPADIIDAVLETSPDDFTDVRQRVELLTEKRGAPEFEDAQVAFIRCKNLAKPQLGNKVDRSLLREREEQDLFDVLLRVEADLKGALGKKDYGQVLKLLAGLRPTVDKFFDEVLVMTEETALRDNRLRLLTRCTEAYLALADLSKAAAPMPV